MTKHKIAFLSYRSDPYSGGQGVYLKNVCEALAKFGHEITIYSGNPLPRVADNISGFFKFNINVINSLEQNSDSHTCMV